MPPVVTVDLLKIVSLPSRGAWIEIGIEGKAMGALGCGRSPRGERGLKSLCRPCAEKLGQSLPSRGAWIEMAVGWTMGPARCGRSPRGERGLKCRRVKQSEIDMRRSPRGERGLKYPNAAQPGIRRDVAPLAGSVD